MLNYHALHNECLSYISLAELESNVIVDLFPVGAFFLHILIVLIDINKQLDELLADLFVVQFGFRVA
jgi:hypothetical protein